MTVVIGHAGADDFASILFVAGVMAAVVALVRLRQRQRWDRPLLVAVISLAGAVIASRVVVSIPRASVRPRAAAHLDIEAPADGAVVAPGSVLVVLRLARGHLVAATSTHLSRDQGHIHIRLDGRPVSSTAGLRVRIGPVAPGRHVLEAEYVALDHGPFSPRVLAVTTFSAAP